ncbi:UNVERIFIED_CONTAM: hypothetical protein HDU68_008064 [Siphonaria sp. JEL0065]|nr:hypothetical protein HDU68_008064 [Siphonaria sp. JEL0065]
MTPPTGLVATPAPTHLQIHCAGFLGLFRSKSKGPRVASDTSSTNLKPTNIIRVAPKNENELTPQLIVDLFALGQAIPSGSMLPRNVVGRFQRGTDEETLAVLSDEPMKKLSWVFGADTIAAFMGKSPTQAMLSVGFSKSWLRNRLSDGTKHRLVVFQCIDQDLVLATWDNIMELIKKHYGIRVYERVSPFLAELKSTHIKDIDPKGRLRYISELSVQDKLAHAEFYSPERILKIKNLTLYDARGFIYHTIGCNYLFQGKGHSRDPNNEDRLEYLIPNRKISDFPNHAKIDLEITASDIVNEYEGRVLSKGERCLQIARMFREKEVIRTDSTLAEGVVGRFVRGIRDEDFEKLSDEPGNEVSFVFGSDTIKSFCGLSASKALMTLGFTKEMLISLSESKFVHKLVLFPEPPLIQPAKWDNMMIMIRECYGQDLYETLVPHLPALKALDYKDIDPNKRLMEIASLPKHEKYKHPEFYSPERIREKKQVSLYEARGFFYHSVRCNALFEGIGYTRSKNGDDDRAEYLVRNSRLVDIEDAVVVDVEFYDHEL